VDLSIGPGEQVAFIGPSGAGKTTLFRILNFSLRPSQGKIFFEGSLMDGIGGRCLRRLRRKIGTIYQHHNLVPRLRVVHNVLAGRLGAWSTPQALLSLARPTEVDLAYSALLQVGIPQKLFARTDELSGGQQQRVAIARVLLQDPDCILADEPVSSVDPSLANRIVRLLIDLSSKRAKTLVMNLHSVDLALTHFPRVIGLKDGQILFDKKSQSITPEDLGALFPTPTEGADILSTEQTHLERPFVARI
jgi:phosphonate transport system ATP-binding protein